MRGKYSPTPLLLVHAGDFVRLILPVFVATLFTTHRATMRQSLSFQPPGNIACVVGHDAIRPGTLKTHD